MNDKPELKLQFGFKCFCKKSSYYKFRRVHTVSHTVGFDKARELYDLAQRSCTFEDWIKPIQKNNGLMPTYDHILHEFKHVISAEQHKPISYFCLVKNLSYKADDCFLAGDYVVVKSQLNRQKRGLPLPLQRVPNRELRPKTANVIVCLDEGSIGVYTGEFTNKGKTVFLRCVFSQGIGWVSQSNVVPMATSENIGL